MDTSAPFLIESVSIESNENFNRVKVRVQTFEGEGLLANKNSDAARIDCDCG